MNICRHVRRRILFWSLSSNEVLDCFINSVELVLHSSNRQAWAERRGKMCRNSCVLALNEISDKLRNCCYNYWFNYNIFKDKLILMECQYCICIKQMDNILCFQWFMKILFDITISESKLNQKHWIFL